MPLIWDRSCTSLGGCPEGTRCAQATQSSLVCDTGLIRDMVEPSLSSFTNTAMVRMPTHRWFWNPCTCTLASWTDMPWMKNVAATQVHGKNFGADYPLMYIAILLGGVLSMVRAEACTSLVTLQSVVMHLTPMFVGASGCHFCCCAVDATDGSEAS
jgi:hypothetical protein